jgi:hypothetical protein
LESYSIKSDSIRGPIFYYNVTHIYTVWSFVKKKKRNLLQYKKVSCCWDHENTLALKTASWQKQGYLWSRKVVTELNFSKPSQIPSQLSHIPFCKNKIHFYASHNWKQTKPFEPFLKEKLLIDKCEYSTKSNHFHFILLLHIKVKKISLSPPISHGIPHLEIFSLSFLFHLCFISFSFLFVFHRLQKSTLKVLILSHFLCWVF